MPRSCASRRPVLPVWPLISSRVGSRRWRPGGLLLWPALAAVLLGSACAAPPGGGAASGGAVGSAGPEPAAGRSVAAGNISSSATLLDRVKAEIGPASCSSASQCRTVAVGHKACGGPESYLAWSTAVSQESRLQAAVAAHAEARRRENEQSGRVSDCMMLADPGARCEAGRCVLATGAGAAVPSPGRALAQ